MLSSNRTKTTPLVLTIAPAAVRHYRTAARILQKELGSEAPSTTDLIHRELADRIPNEIADEYLEWCRRQKRVQRSIVIPRPTRKMLGKNMPLRRATMLGQFPADPSNN